jgi:general secretion pathway protein G
MLLTTVRTARQKATRRAGFTLLEVLVVVAILVILAGVASISIFRYMEDAKVGRAKSDMRAIEGAIKTFYIQNGDWPPQDNLAAIAPLLEQGQVALVDPWGQPYTWELKTYADETDGTTKQRPVVYCQPPGGKPVITVPDLNTGR